VQTLLGDRRDANVANGPLHDGRMEAAAEAMAVRTGALKFQFAADRWKQIVDHFEPPCHKVWITLFHPQRGSVSITPPLSMGQLHNPRTAMAVLLTCSPFLHPTARNIGATLAQTDANTNLRRCALVQPKTSFSGN
jgi:hypothetical protein